MSSDEFVAKYGAAPDDFQKVSDFAKAQGLQVVETNAARRSVVVSGTAAQMSKAFAVTLGATSTRLFVAVLGNLKPRAIAAETVSSTFPRILLISSSVCLAWITAGSPNATAETRPIPQPSVLRL